jgi:hypothetical protein
MYESGELKATGLGGAKDTGFVILCDDDEDDNYEYDDNRSSSRSDFDQKEEFCFDESSQRFSANTHVIDIETMFSANHENSGSNDMQGKSNYDSMDDIDKQVESDQETSNLSLDDIFGPDV